MDINTLVFLFAASYIANLVFYVYNEVYNA